jgi:hypothetical protein
MRSEPCILQACTRIISPVALCPVADWNAFRQIFPAKKRGAIFFAGDGFDPLDWNGLKLHAQKKSCKSM